METGREAGPGGGRRTARAAAAARRVLLCASLAAAGCDDLIRAGRAAPDDAGPADPAPSADAAPPPSGPPTRPGADGTPRLLGEPAWEGERSGVAEELDRIFADEGLEGVIVVHDLRTGATLRSDDARAGRRLPPDATFEILGALVALESGAVAGAFDPIAREDGETGALGASDDAATLASAFGASSADDFVEIVRRIGMDEMAAWVRRTGYGSGNVGRSPGPFWIEGPLEISPDEQIGFLRRLHAGRLPFSSRSLDAVRQLMLLDRGPGWSLHGKTAWHRTGRTDRLWFVGWAERGEEAAYFAIQFRNESPTRDVPILRERIYRRALTALGLVPSG